MPKPLRFQDRTIRVSKSGAMRPCSSRSRRHRVRVLEVGFQGGQPLRVTRLDVGQVQFRPFWIVRVFAALFVGSIVVYLFQRLAKDTERDLKNSLAGDIALAFMFLALLVSHAEGLYLVSVTACGRGGPTF